jgi:hypothetical protein
VSEGCEDVTRWFNILFRFVSLYTVLRTPFYTEEAERIYVMTEQFRGCGNGLGASIMPTQNDVRRRIEYGGPGENDVGARARS